MTHFAIFSDLLAIAKIRIFFYIDIMLSQPPEKDVIEVPLEIRDSYIRAISALSPYDEIENRDIETTLQWLKSAEQLNKPYNMEEHLGVFAVVLSQDRERTFLLNHRKAQLWLPPGGHVDLGQKLHECALMEAGEELAIKEPKLLTEVPIFLTRTVTQGMNAGHIDVTSWLLVEGNEQSDYQIQTKEASQSGWVKIGELLQASDLSNLHRGFKKMLQLGFVRS